MYDEGAHNVCGMRMPSLLLPYYSKVFLLLTTASLTLAGSLSNLQCSTGPGQYIIGNEIMRLVYA